MRDENWWPVACWVSGGGRRLSECMGVRVTERPDPGGTVTYILCRTYTPYSSSSLLRHLTSRSVLSTAKVRVTVCLSVCSTGTIVLCCCHAVQDSPLLSCLLHSLGTFQLLLLEKPPCALSSLPVSLLCLCRTFVSATSVFSSRLL